jgi:hypothetical protein
MVRRAMATNLRSTLDTLASSFADAVLAAIRGANLHELLAESASAPRGRGRPRSAPAAKVPSAAARASAPARKSKGRLARRSPEQIAKTLGTILALLRGKKAGMRSEQIRAALALDVREMPRVLHEGLKTKKLKSKGHKRATQYSVA